MNEVLIVLVLVIILVIIVFITIARKDKMNKQQKENFEDLKDLEDALDENDITKRIIPDNIHADKPTTESTQDIDCKVYEVQENDTEDKEVEKVVIDSEEQ